MRKGLLTPPTTRGAASSSSAAVGQSLTQPAGGRCRPPCDYIFHDRLSLTILLSLRVCVFVSSFVYLILNSQLFTYDRTGSLTVVVGAANNDTSAADGGVAYAFKVDSPASNQKSKRSPPTASLTLRWNLRLHPAADYLSSEREDGQYASYSSVIYSIFSSTSSIDYPKRQKC